MVLLVMVVLYAAGLALLVPRARRLVTVGGPAAAVRRIGAELAVSRVAILWVLLGLGWVSRLDLLGFSLLLVPLLPEGLLFPYLGGLDRATPFHGLVLSLAVALGSVGWAWVVVALARRRPRPN